VSARIEPPRRTSWLARLAYGYTRRMTGKVPDPLHIIARRTRLMLATMVYEWAISNTPKLSPRLKMLAGLRVSTLIGCPF
jgi:hypothetical protein